MTKPKQRAWHCLVSLNFRTQQTWLVESPCGIPTLHNPPCKLPPKNPVASSCWDKTNIGEPFFENKLPNQKRTVALNWSFFQRARVFLVLTGHQEDIRLRHEGSILKVSSSQGALSARACTWPHSGQARPGFGLRSSTSQKGQWGDLPKWALFCCFCCFPCICCCCF